MRALYRAITFLLALIAFSVPALAEERILAFGSTLFIKQDGTLEVVERIAVNAENVSIRHGIYRDFPTRYSTPNGGRMKVGFTLIDTMLDDRPVEHVIEKRGNGVRIKLGSADSYVSPGHHLYYIHYRVTRELGYFDKFDELYWNVTGNGWDFPIDRAGAQIQLPKPVAFGQRAFYTGPQGSTANDAEVIEEQPGQITIVATRPLGPREGLTVAVAFPKGVVDEPSADERLGWWLADMLPMIVAGFGLAAVIGYLFYAWKRAGRDPRPGTLVPLFAPPDDISPAAMRYVTEQGMDNRAFAAALIDAGVKGHVILGEDEGVLIFSGKKYIAGATGARGPLSEPEQAAITTLVGPGQRLDFDNENHAAFSAAKDHMAKGFKARFDEKSFKRNHLWATAAVLVWAAGAYLTALSLVLLDGSLPPGRLLVAPLAAFAAYFIYSLSSKQTAVSGCVLKGLAIFCAVAAIGFGGLTIMLAIGTLRWQPILIAAIGLPIVLSSWFWISAPTTDGRSLLDRIAGFKQYLSITERERLDRMQAPRDTLQMFERWLPYAVALEVENRWADRFAGQLATAAAAGGQRGFAWYSGSHSPWSDADGFANSIGNSLSGSISSASTAPGSSGGSGGGGSSGGGGGGGGGGW